MVSCGHVEEASGGTEAPTTAEAIGKGTNVGGPVSTRRLIIAALLCGLAILVAFTAQILTAK